MCFGRVECCHRGDAEDEDKIHRGDAENAEKKKLDRIYMIYMLFFLNDL